MKVSAVFAILFFLPGLAYALTEFGWMHMPLADNALFFALAFLGLSLSMIWVTEWDREYSEARKQSWYKKYEKSVQLNRMDYNAIWDAISALEMDEVEMALKILRRAKLRHDDL